MKRILCALLACLMLLFCTAMAEGNDVWEIGQIYSGAAEDFDNDGTIETVVLTCSLDEYEDGSFTIAVGDQAFTVDDCVYLDKTLYTMRIGTKNYWYGTMFMVNEYGPSDDPITYCFVYSDGQLCNAGMIPQLARYLDVDDTGIITADIRAFMVGTWAKNAEFCLARGDEWNEEDYITTYYIAEIPKAVYAMKMVVDLNVDLPVCASLYDMEPTTVLEAGQKVILSASDDVSRLYVTAPGGEGGWVRMTNIDWQEMILLDGRWTPIDDVFGNIFYAD